MRGREYIEHLRKAGTAKLRNERGVSMLEYTFLIALIGGDPRRHPLLPRGMDQ